MRLGFMPLALLMGAPSFAQHAEPSRLYPISVPIRDAGVLHLDSGTWSRSGSDSSGAPPTVVYRNDCTWTGGDFYRVIEHCEEVYDEGRIPSPTDPSAPAGAFESNEISVVEIGYCTGFPTGAVDIELALFDAELPCTPAASPPPGAGETIHIDLAGTGLPGDNSGGGSLACWTVSINLGSASACLLSDGDGQWDGGGGADSFRWMFAHRMDNAIHGIGSGPIARGEPTASAPGACSYSIACGVDPITGTPCGSGLGLADQFWLNAEHSGGAAFPPAQCPGASHVGSTCFWFGAWPANPFASFHLALGSSSSCSRGGCTDTYCTSAQNPSSSGCVASIFALKCQPESGAGDFTVQVSGTEAFTMGMIFYGLQGRTASPFSSGQLCVQPPLKRTQVRGTSGTVGQPCTGSLELTINDPAGLDFPAGTVVNFQGWTRDPAATPAHDVSDALEVVYQ